MKKTKVESEEKYSIEENILYIKREISMIIHDIDGIKPNWISTRDGINIQFPSIAHGKTFLDINNHKTKIPSNGITFADIPDNQKKEIYNTLIRDKKEWFENNR